MPIVIRDDRCTFIKADGTRCKGKRMRHGEVCGIHDPESAERLAEGRSRGGIERSQVLKSANVLPSDTSPLALKNVDDVVAAIALTINQVRTGQIAVNVGNCIGVLAGVLLKALEVGDLAQRIAHLESKQIQPRRIAS